MNTQMRWLLLTLLLLALVLVACDRRDVQPREASEATDTVIVDPAASDRAVDTDPLPPPATSPCAGLSDQEAADCRARERGGEATPPSEPPGNADEGVEQR